MDKIIQAFYENFKCCHKQIEFHMISRRSSEMGGTRFHSRGLNDDGYVANYVETEQFLVDGQNVATYIQIRGSPPLFWKQGSVLSAPKLSKTPEFAQKYFKIHINRLEKLYGKLHCVNLMSRTKSGEDMLSEYFLEMVTQYNKPSITYEHIDFHGVTNGTDFSALNSFLQNHEKFINENGCHLFSFDATSGPVLVASSDFKHIKTQQLVFRTNCVDCLDRTNAFQSKLSYLALPMMAHQMDHKSAFDGHRLDELDYQKILSQFTHSFKHLWADHGDWLSKIYTGTGATTSSTTRKGKGGLLGLLDHKMKSIGRFYLGNFEDTGKQKAINTILGTNLEDQSVEKMEKQLKDLESSFTKNYALKVGFVSWCSYIDHKYINEELIAELMAGVDLPNLDILIVGVQEAVKTGGMNLFKHDAKFIAEKYDYQLSKYMISKNIKLKKYTTNSSGGKLD